MHQAGPFGIDALALAVPEQYLDLTTLAAARGVAPGKYLDGLGVQRMSIAGPHEDPVSLGVLAARRLFETSGADASKVGLLVVGSETGVDHSKPIAIWVHKLLGLSQQCRVYETKHACFGGTAGVQTAVEWLASGAARGRTALVICSDIARYELASPGEPTQGAGAVAILLTQKPRLLELEPGVSGSYAREVDDFWRPLYRKDAVVDGHLSVQCYLDALAGAYEAWKQVCRETGQVAPLVRRCYHVPYGKMAKKAHRHARTLDGLTEEQADASYAAEVAPSLRLPAQVGNVYTGSLWLSLASLLEAQAGALEGQRVGLFSYGSGCAAEYFAGTVAQGAGAFANKLQLSLPLEKRKQLSFTEYEAIRRGDTEADRRPAEAPVPGAGPRFLGVRDDRRVYQG